MDNFLNVTFWLCAKCSRLARLMSDYEVTLVNDNSRICHGHRPPSIR